MFWKKTVAMQKLCLNQEVDRGDEPLLERQAGKICQKPEPLRKSLKDLECKADIAHEKYLIGIVTFPSLLRGGPGQGAGQAATGERTPWVQRQRLNLAVDIPKFLPMHGQAKSFAYNERIDEELSWEI